MKPVDIAWIVSFIAWLVFFILFWIVKKDKDPYLMLFFNILQLVAVGFMWVFTGFSHGWW